MKKLILQTLLLGLLVANGARAEDICTVIGYHDFKTNTYDGPTFCRQVSINQIIVRGPLQSDQSILSGLTAVSGPIYSNNTKFDEITDEDNGSPGKISLKNNSRVKHDVVFKGINKGVVTIDGSSSINGKVINGSINRV